mmetsp:Transcript_117356/g.233907  ORF Transcript_117356/g.233907 Transcript_117356/m.233907 type:complete len:117 (-) Transcript_117356:147-497(-)
MPDKCSMKMLKFFGDWDSHFLVVPLAHALSQPMPLSADMATRCVSVGQSRQLMLPLLAAHHMCLPDTSRLSLNVRLFFCHLVAAGQPVGNYTICSKQKRKELYRQQLHAASDGIGR